MNESEYTLIINNKKHLWPDLHAVWQYRDLLFLFIKREFIVKYKQTILGPAWAIINPVLTTLVFTVIFGKLAKLTTADAEDMGNVLLPSFLFYMSGTICWTYFSTTVRAVSNTFLANAKVMSKVYYPRIITPIAVCVSGLITFGIQLVLFLLLLAAEMIRGNAVIHIGPALVLVPLTVLQMVMLGLGIGIIISAMTTKYRDMAMLVDFGLHLWQYASPVAYGLAIIPANYRGWFLLNPMAEIIVTYRYAVFGQGYFEVSSWILGWGITMAVLTAGLMLFQRIEKNFVDTI